MSNDIIIQLICSYVPTQGNWLKWQFLKSRMDTSRFRKSKMSMRSIMSYSLPGVPISMFTPSSSIFFMSVLMSSPPTRSRALTFDRVEMKGSATWYIWEDSSLVGEMIIPKTCKYCRYQYLSKRKRKYWQQFIYRNYLPIFIGNKLFQRYGWILPK